MLRFTAIPWVGILLLVGGAAGCGSAGRSVEEPNGAREATRQVVLRVPNMHCPHGCYPVVAQTLSSIRGVQEVELVPQSTKDAIDDPRVTITYTGEFDTAAAASALAAANFPDSIMDGGSDSAAPH